MQRWRSRGDAVILGTGVMMIRVLTASSMINIGLIFM
jgi:hypothetical protein